MIELLSPWEEVALEKGLKKGREEGREEGWRNALITALETKFGAVPDELSRKIQSLESEDALQRALQRALASETLEDFRRQL